MWSGSRLVAGWASASAKGRTFYEPEKKTQHLKETRHARSAPGKPGNPSPGETPRAQFYGQVAQWSPAGDVLLTGSEEHP